MIRTKLLTATAVAAILAAPAAFAQDAQPDLPPPPVADETTQDMPTTPQGAPTIAPAEAMAPAQPSDMQTAETAPVAGDNVINVLRAQGEFTTLLEALDAAQLTQVIEQDPDITILAPTDAAFAALPAEELTRLTDPANTQELRQLLLYHVINADVRSEQLEGARGGVPTASGAEILLDGSQGAIRADAATVTQADLRGSNGAIFVIDQVLTPAESMASMGDSEELTAPDGEAEQPPADATTPAPSADEDTVTAPDGSPTQSVETVASQPVPNPADTPTDQQPDAAPAPAEPMPAQSMAPDTMGAPADPTPGAIPPGAPGAPEGTLPTASDPTIAPPVVTSPPTDDDADASDEDEDPLAPDQPLA